MREETLKMLLKVNHFLLSALILVLAGFLISLIFQDFHPVLFVGIIMTFVFILYEVFHWYKNWKMYKSVFRQNTIHASFTSKSILILVLGVIMPYSLVILDLIIVLKS